MNGLQEQIQFENQGSSVFILFYHKDKKTLLVFDNKVRISLALLFIFGRREINIRQ